jgi:hypothetical protein
MDIPHVIITDHVCCTVCMYNEKIVPPACEYLLTYTHWKILFCILKCVDQENDSCHFYVS